jgi:ligand-binding sensor domain-containing protein/signal transduction histidine kinase
MQSDPAKVRDVGEAQERFVVHRAYGNTVCAILLFCFATMFSLAEAPPTTLRLSEYQKQDWQVEDGLPENNVRMIAQRPDGALLLATSFGLATFDGMHFQGVPIEVDGLIENEAVNAMLYGRDQDLWIGTDGRGVLHRTSSGTVNISERAGWFNERIRSLYQDSQGALWIATQNGIRRFIDGHMETFPQTGMISGGLISSFAEDNEGGMFFITSTGLFHWQKGTIRHIALRAASTNTPVAVYRDPQHRIWVGTMTSILQIIPHKDSARTMSDQFDQVSEIVIRSPVTAMCGDASGNLWIGTRHDGIWRLGSDGLSHWSTHDGLADDSIGTIFIDNQQNLWIGMLSGGLSRWRKGAFAPYGAPEGFPSTFSANTFADSHGDLWLGTWGKGLFRRHQGRLLDSTPPGMPIATPIRALAEDRRGHIWVGTWINGVYRYDGHIWRHYLLGVESPGNAISSILPDRRGGLWVGTYTGLFYFPTGEPDRLNQSHLLDSKLITCMIEDHDGSILVGTSTGLFRVRDGQIRTVDGLPHPYVLTLMVDSMGQAWAGTKAGALIAVRQDHTLPLPSGSAIASLLVDTAVEDGDGHLWLGTSRGIVRLSLMELHDAINGRTNQLSTIIFSKSDGMRSSECGGASNPTSTRMADGTLWFVTTKGFVRTTDILEKADSSTPAATITGWTLSNSYNATDKITGRRADLDPGQTDIIFFFSSGSLSNPEHVEFRYRLSGYDAEWTSTGYHAVHYRRLPPGKYRFEVQARNSGEAWLSPAATLSVRQHPHIYQTWYFYLALLVLATAIAVHLFRRRVRLMQGRIGIVLEERNRIACECHDTLMAGFAAISWQLEATAKLFRDTDSASTPAAKSCELARSMVTHCQAEARRIIWDLRATEEVTSVLSQALSRAITENHIQETIETTLDVEGDEVPLAPGCVHHLVCIGQEAVSNAMRHGQPSHIAVHLKYESDALNLSIRDDGRGFLAADRSASRRGHFGIPVMEERARKLGGTLRLQTTAGIGTEVMVRVSFNALQQPANQEHHVIRWIGI